MPRAPGHEFLDRVDRAGVVGAVEAGLYDHHAAGVQPAVQRSHFLDRGRGRRVDARRNEREALRISHNVRMAVAGALRNVELDRGNGGDSCGNQKVTSR